jgi:hypothetical protein
VGLHSRSNWTYFMFKWPCTVIILVYITEVYKICNRIYNDKNWNQKNMKECDKRNSHISSKLHMICISSNNCRHPVANTFTTLLSNRRIYTHLRINNQKDASSIQNFCFVTKLYMFRASAVPILRRWQNKNFGYLMHLVGCLYKGMWLFPSSFVSPIMCRRCTMIWRQGMLAVIRCRIFVFQFAIQNFKH